MASTQRTQITEPAHSLLYNPSALKTNEYHDIEDILTTVDSCLTNKFNDSQKLVFRNSFIERVTLLWGPPGTGKTTVLAGIVLGWIEKAQKDNNPICIGLGSSNWTAIDNLLVEIAKLVKHRKEVTGDFLIDVEINRVRSGLGDAFEYGGINDLVTNEREAQELVQEMESLSKCIIVGSTWKQLYNLSKDGVYGNPSMPKKWFDLLLIDEASQVKVSHASAYFLLLKELANVVFAGDDKQLGPIFGFEMDDKSEGLFDCIYTYMKETHKIQPKQIIDNYRSNEHITSWPNQRFYENRLNPIYAKKRLSITLPEGQPDNWPAGLIWNDIYLQILDPEYPIVVITYPPQTFTVFNPFEAQVTAALTSLYRNSIDGQIQDQRFYEEHMGIVTPHRAQRSNIQNLLTKYSGINANSSIVVDTVDRFQGQERDLIISSYTVADKDFVNSEEAFILDPRRFNVSLTRAKSKFIMLISESILQHLPSDKDTAINASHIQLFVEKYCVPFAQVELSFLDLNGQTKKIDCVLRVLK